MFFGGEWGGEGLSSQFLVDIQFNTVKVQEMSQTYNYLLMVTNFLTLYILQQSGGAIVLDAEATSTLSKKGVTKTDDSFKFIWFQVSYMDFRAGYIILRKVLLLFERSLIVAVIMFWLHDLFCFFFPFFLLPNSKVVAANSSKFSVSFI